MKVVSVTTSPLARKWFAPSNRMTEHNYYITGSGLGASGQKSRSEESRPHTLADQQKYNVPVYHIYIGDNTLNTAYINNLTILLLNSTLSWHGHVS